MKILYFSTWFPYPPDNGSKIRAYEIATRLASRHDVELIAFYKPGEEPSTTWAPFPVWPVPDPVPQEGWSAWAKGYLSGWPRHLYARQSTEAQKLVKDRVAAFGPDVLLAWELTAWVHCLDVAGIPKALDLLQLTEMKDLTRKSRGLIQSWRGGLTWLKFAGFVRDLVRSYDWLFLPTDRELALLIQSVGPVLHASVSGNGVDPEKWRPVAAPRCPQVLIYPGSPTFSFNWEAVVYFAEEILPLIRREAPQVRWVITGRYEPAHKAWADRQEGIELAGYIQDMTSFLPQHGACVVPLRSGGGSRIKILEALAAGVPVISTSKGAEGLHLVSGEEILVADEPFQFARHVLDVLRGPGLREKLASQGRARVLAQHTWAASVSRLEERLGALRGTKGP